MKIMDRFWRRRAEGNNGAETGSRFQLGRDDNDWAPLHHLGLNGGITIVANQHCSGVRMEFQHMKEESEPVWEGERRRLASRRIRAHMIGNERWSRHRGDYTRWPEASLRF